MMPGASKRDARLQKGAPLASRPRGPSRTPGGLSRPVRATACESGRAPRGRRQIRTGRITAGFIPKQIRAQRVRGQGRTARLPQIDGEIPELGPIQIHYLRGQGRRARPADDCWQIALVRVTFARSKDQPYPFCSLYREQPYAKRSNPELDTTVLQRGALGVRQQIPQKAAKPRDVQRIPRKLSGNLTRGEIHN